jgi:hypothetical protein
VNVAAAAKAKATRAARHTMGPKGARGEVLAYWAIPVEPVHQSDVHPLEHWPIASR